MTSLVNRSSPVVVKPSEPMATTGAIKLSSFDKSFIGFPPFTVLLVFEHHSNREATIKAIERGLSQALIHYYPFSGRVTSGADDDDEICIRCTGEGVEFIRASTDRALKDVTFFDYTSPGASTILEELAVYYPAGSYGPTDPSLSVQVTEFSCGGFTLGVSWDHAIADGAGIAQFLGAISELARGLPQPSVVPVRCDDSVLTLPPLFDPVEQAMTMCPEPLDMAVLDITVPTSLINRIKAEFRGCCNGQQCTIFEAVSAVLWKCRTRAIMSNPETPVFLSFACDVRKHLGAEDSYYGNCIANQLAMATRVADTDVTELVKMIKRAKAKLPDRIKENDEGSNQLQGLGTRYDMLHLSSWRNLGFDMVDFGSGGPVRVMCHGQMMPPVPVCVMFPPCKGKDGVSVLAICVKKEHADAFLGELSSC